MVISVEVVIDDGDCGNIRFIVVGSGEQCGWALTGWQTSKTLAIDGTVQSAV